MNKLIRAFEVAALEKNEWHRSNPLLTPDNEAREKEIYARYMQALTDLENALVAR